MQGENLLGSLLLAAALSSSTVFAAVEARPIDFEFRQAIASVEFKARSIQSKLKESTDQSICFELGSMVQAQSDFQRMYWTYGTRFRRIEPRLYDLADQAEASMQYCSGKQVSVRPPKKGSEPREGNRKLLSETLKKLEKTAERMKKLIDMDQQ